MSFQKYHDLPTYLCRQCNRRIDGDTHRRIVDIAGWLEERNKRDDHYDPKKHKDWDHFFHGD
jgi:hypothetical protein